MIKGGGLFNVPATDKSLEYLGIVLGDLANGSLGSIDASLIQSLFYIFNETIFVLGILIIIYTTVVGTISTAQEGEFLGKQKWHPILVPLRALLGIYLLLPHATGYNWIQASVIWLIIQGIGAANSLWKQVIYYNEVQGSQYSDLREVNLLEVGKTVNAIFDANVCMAAINDNPAASQLMDEKISVYRWNDHIEWGRASRAGQEQPLCGSIAIPDVHSHIPHYSNTTDVTVSRKNLLASAILSAQEALMAPAYEAAHHNRSNAQSAASFVAAANILTNGAKSLSDTFESLSKINEQALAQGWIHAGSYYFQIVQGVGPGASVSFKSTGIDTNTITAILGATLGSQILQASQNAANTYIANSADRINAFEPEKKLKLATRSSNSEVGSLFSNLLGGLIDDLVQKVSHDISSGDASGDPIISMASYGAWLTTSCELLFWSVIGLYMMSWFGSTVLSTFLPVGSSGVSAIFNFFMVLIFAIISLLYLAGVTLALYVPLIPYFVFTFTAFSWIILVIEALLGAPLIALSLIVPSEDEIGKSGHAMVILLGLCLRPALMIVGFILAVQLLYVAIKMLNFGFWEALLSSTGASHGVGMFGMIAVLLLYVGIVTAFTHEAFSLIYILPNKVLRWISGSGEDDIAGQKTKELKGYVQKGGSLVKGTMSGLFERASGKKAS